MIRRGHGLEIFETYQTNLGVESVQIQESLYSLCHNILYWLKNQTFPMDEIAVRFHHRLRTIQAFPKGNGRHARLMTDGFLMQEGALRFIWRKNSSNKAPHLRTIYLNALKNADQGDYQPLLAFARMLGLVRG